MSDCTIRLPLGYSPLYWGMQTDADGGEIATELRSVLGRFEHVQFHVCENSKGFFQLWMKRTSVPTAQGGTVAIEENFMGCLGDAHRMKYGEKVRAERFIPIGTSEKMLQVTFHNGR